MKKSIASKKGKVVKIKGAIPWMRYAILGVICALVIGIYIWRARSGMIELDGLTAKNTYYNLLAQGFSAGQLNLKTDVPPGLAQLADPYDPAASGPYRWIYGQPLHDVSYYKGKLYLYFGITPALVLFWPYAVLTGHYLLHKEATVIFFSIGFLAGVGLLLAAWRRYFADVSVWIIASCIIALGLANLTPVILQRSDVYEVAISCGYAMTMLTLAGIWRALHDSRRQWQWLAAASLAYGLAVGARPSLLFGAVILLVPVIQAWREKRRVGSLLMAAIVPITFVGLGLMVYNALRFDNPLDFGQYYQLPRWAPESRHEFGLRYLWFNFRVAFLEPARWSSHFPYVEDILVPSFANGGWTTEHPFGVLSNMPLVWLALAVPLACRGKSTETRATLRWFLWAVTLIFGVCALTICLHCSLCVRYEVEFADTLVLLAVIGFIGLERTLAGQMFWRRVVLCGWGLLLTFSVAFNLSAMHAVPHINFGEFLLKQGNENEAMAELQKGVDIQPDNAEAHYYLADLLLKQGKVDEAIAHYQKAFERQPDTDDYRSALGELLLKQGKADEAIAHYQKVLQISPGLAGTHNDMGLAFGLKGNVDEAIVHYQKALEINPNLAEAHDNLGFALQQLGKTDEAISHFQRALEIKPDFAAAHDNLGLALAQKGKMDEAILHFKKALEIKPAMADAHENLGIALAQKGKLDEAIPHLQKALEIKPDVAEAHFNLANAYFGKGKMEEAVVELKSALRLKPDDTQAQKLLSDLLLRMKKP